MNIFIKQFNNQHHYANGCMITGGPNNLGKSKHDNDFCHHWTGSFSIWYGKFQLELIK